MRLREEVLEGVRRREEEMRRLDMPPSPPLVVCPAFGPPAIQPPLRYLQLNCTEWGALTSALHQVPPADIRRDFYQLDLTRGTLIRWHASGRVRLFTPENSRLPQPLNLQCLTGRRRTLVTELANRYLLDDNWRRDQAQRTLAAEWKGRTELEVDLNQVPGLENQPEEQ